jgi:hypothetical protein
VALTLLMTTLTAFSSPVVVLAAIGTTAIVCTLVSIFACQTKVSPAKNTNVRPRNLQDQNLIL